jgi:phosphatidylinositol alpha-mannosyltransferase
MRRRFSSAGRHERQFAAWVGLQLAAEQYDAVHSLGARDAQASILANGVRRGRRTVYTNLGNPVRWYWDKRPDRRAHRMVVERVDAYGCLSRYSLEALRRDFGREGVLTPGGVNLGEFKPAAHRAVEPTLLFSGALDQAGKGLPVLLEAAAIVRRSEPRLRVWLSGPGNPVPALEAAPAAVRDAVEVLPLGEPSDQASRYASAWVTVLPSQGEAFGLVILESLASGTPVVGSDDAALPELITEGATGTTCDPSSAASVADAINRAFQLADRAGIARVCRESAAAYDWDQRLAPDLERLYQGT